jgi:hypothetical protein
VVTRAALVALALASAVAHAGKAEDEQARKLYAAGVQAYDSGQYPMAISLFEEAYRLVPRASVAFSLGQAYRRQHLADGDPAKLERAVESYRKYLADAPDGDRRDEALRHIADLELIRARMEAGKKPDARAVARTQLVVFSSTKGARGSIGGSPLEPLPLVLDLQPGPHKVHVEADGHFAREVEGVAVEGRLVPIEVSLTERPGRLTVRAPAGARVDVDGRRVGTAPLGKALELPAGAHFVAVHRRGHRPFAREVALARGGVVTIDAVLPTTTQRKASRWVLGGAGALLVAGGVSTGLALLASSDASAYQDRIDAGETLSVADRDAHNAAAARHDDWAAASYVFYGGAAALAVTALVLYVLDDPRPDVRVGIVGGVAGGGGGAGVTVGWVRAF